MLVGGVDFRRLAFARTARDLRRRNDPPVFETVIRQANQIAAAAELSPERRTLKQKYGYGDLAVRYIDLANELLEKLDAK